MNTVWFFCDGIDGSLHEKMKGLVRDFDTTEMTWIDTLAHRTTVDELHNALTTLLAATSHERSVIEFVKDRTHERVKIIHVFVRLIDDSTQDIDRLIEVLKKLIRTTLCHISLHFILGTDIPRNRNVNPLMMRDLDRLSDFLEENDRSHRIMIATLVGAVTFERRPVDYLNCLFREKKGLLFTHPLLWLRQKAANAIPPESIPFAQHQEFRPLLHESACIDLTSDPDFHELLIAVTGATQVMSPHSPFELSFNFDQHPFLDLKNRGPINIVDTSNSQHFNSYFHKQKHRESFKFHSTFLSPTQNADLTFFYDDSVWNALQTGRTQAWTTAIEALATHIKSLLPKLPTHTQIIWSGVRPLDFELQSIVAPFGSKLHKFIPIHAPNLIQNKVVTAHPAL